MLVYIIGFVTLVFVFKFFRSGNKEEKPFPLQKPDWKKDVVYLVQFPVSPMVFFYLHFDRFSLKWFKNHFLLHTWDCSTSWNYTWLKLHTISVNKKYMSLSRKQTIEIKLMWLNINQINLCHLFLRYENVTFRKKFPTTSSRM